MLYRAGELTLADAIGVLQAAAESNGLVAAIGEDAVAAIIGAAFAGAHDS